MAEATIAHLTKAVIESSSDSEKRDDAQLKELATLNKHLSDYFKAQKLAEGDKLEKDREKKRKEKEKVETPSLSDAIDTTKKGGFLAIVAGFVGALSGFLVGAFEGVLMAIKSLVKLLPKRVQSVLKLITGGIDNGLSKIKSVVDNFSKNLSNAIKNLSRAFTQGLTGLSQGIRDIKGRFKKLNFVEKLSQTIGKLFRPFAEFGSDVSKLTKMVTGEGKKTAGFISKIGDVFKGMKSAFGGFFKIFRLLGRVIFFPVTIIMTMIDAFRGFKEGFEKNGILGGVLGSISEVLVGIVGMPLDLLKSVVGWIASKLGFENFAETLSEFSFSDMIRSTFSSITNGIMSLVDGIKNSFEELSKLSIKEITKRIFNIASKIMKFPTAVTAGGAAAIGALAPGGRTPLEAFNQAFNKIMSGGTFDTGTSEKMSLGKTKGQDIGKMRDTIKENEIMTQTSSNVVIQDNSTTSAPSAPSQPIPLPGPSSSFDHFDPGTRMA